MPWPAAIANIDKSTAVRQGGSMCPSEGGDLTGNSACTNANEVGVQQEPNLGPSQGMSEVWLCDITNTPRKGDWGLHRAEISHANFPP